ncbi:phytanoyl-CoA dioxygenase family protein [Streptomyces sp. NPDC002952]|uniref:phytanoyl-CoA dioxygenase family protein n=1 Tax=Streptomyces sp. NPDC002952 TaxID=3364673 RepID=UPI0036967261
MLRATPPVRFKTEPGRFAHQDYAYWKISDMVTSWVPFMEIPPLMGGLALRIGSHRDPPVPLVIPSFKEEDWATAHYMPGDVLLFHCLTAHAALPNLTEKVRMSGDFRWQRATEPVARELVCGTGE